MLRFLNYIKDLIKVLAKLCFYLLALFFFGAFVLFIVVSIWKALAP